MPDRSPLQRFLRDELELTADSFARLDEERRLAVEELVRRAALDSPAIFAEAAGIGTPARHHEAMLAEVERLERDESDVLVILAPPGSAKSSYLSIATPLWLLARNPRTQILAAANTDELAERWGRRLRNMLSEPRIASLTGCRLADDSQAARRWATASGGEYRAVGVGSSALGYRADWLLIDDPVTGVEQASSETQLQKIVDWYDADARTRLKPGGKVILVMQRLAYNDLAGVLMRRYERDPHVRLRVLTLRMVAEDDDPLGRAPGERLWPEWYDDRMLADAQRDTVRWQTMYQQRPVLGTAEWCRPEWISHTPTPPLESMRLYVGCDFATGSARGDYTALVLTGVTQDADGARHLHVVDVFRARVDPLSSIDQLIAWSKRYELTECFIDDDFFAKSLKGVLQERVRISSARLFMRPVPMGGKDKETRASALRVMLADRRVHIPRGAPFTGPLVSELLGFPVLQGAGVDDQVDALGLVARQVLRLAGKSADRQSQREPIYAFKRTESGALVTTSTLDQLWEDNLSRSRSRRIL